jgi:mannose-6-phosphate isomerase-like protein (cupin superfamily)
MTTQTENPSLRYRVRWQDVQPDESLREAEGFNDMDVRWLVTGPLVGSKKSVVGRSVFPPGAKHDLHLHPHAEEWWVLESGEAVGQIGEKSEPFDVKKGDVVHIPQNVFHSLENQSKTEPVVLFWGFSGACTLDEAGIHNYVPEGSE